MRRIMLLALVCFARTPALSQGAILESFDQLAAVPVLETTRASLSTSADVSLTVPQPRTQGATGTCVSWAVTYGAGSQALRRAGRADAILSPAFSYNQVAGDATCQMGTTISRTLDLLKQTGGLPLTEFTFDAGWCGRMPTAAERQRAETFRITGWKRLNARELDQVKGALSRGYAVIFAMRPGSKFYALKGDAVFKDAEEPGRGHAMIVVGYDDMKQAFRVQNSHGSGWGKAGYGWLGYDLWRLSVDVGFIID